MSSLVRFATPLLSALLASLGMSQGGFQPGDLYLNSAAAAGGGLLRIDPLSGAAGLVVNFPSNTRAISYDPFRDRIVAVGDLGSGMGVYAIDPAGLGSKLTSTFPRGIAPTGDGRIYMIGGFSFAVPLFDRVGYVDAAGSLQFVLNQAGTADFSLSTGFEKALGLVYDQATNSLLTVTGPGTGACPGGSTGMVSVYRIPLNAQGNQVAGPLACAQFDVSPGVSDEAPVGLSRGPAGSVILVVDNNSNDAFARILRIEPQTMAINPFAITGPYAGAAATNAGCYSNLRNGTVILNTGTDKLHLFTAGSSGAGLAYGSGPLSPGGSSAELVAMASIDGFGVQYGLEANLNSISLSAGGSQALSIFAGPAQAGRVYLLLGSLSGWNPGISLGALNLPLNFDSYLLYTLSNPSAAPLSGNPGILNPQGQANAAVSFPAGSNPNFAGLKLHHAALAVDNLLNITWTSNPAPLLLVP
jgi:hypothetical protein